jgi:cell division septation protein DedD
MKAKDFREIQVSSTLLVVIFLCVLVLGVFIFLLGVSVGKRQVQITAATRVVAQQIQEPAKDQGALKTEEQPPAKPEPETKAPVTTPSSAGQGKPAVQNPPAKGPTGSVDSQKTAAKTAPAPASGSGLFYVQVAAFTDKTQAAAEADKFKKRGYPVVVAEPRPSDTKTWYRVRVGSYPTREKAAEVLTKLTETAKKKTDYRIVKD